MIALIGVGAKPADLPASVLARADEVIE